MVNVAIRFSAYDTFIVALSSGVVFLAFNL